MAFSFSILIPTHDRSELLARALDSLAEVRKPAALTAEVVVVANACSDDTLEVVAAKAAGHPLALRAVEEPVANLNVARNRGLNESNGEIVALLDDDVWLEPSWLEALDDAFANPAADLVAGRVLLWWEAVSPPPWLSSQVERLLSRLDLGDEACELARPSQLVGANFAFRRRVIARIGQFFPGLDRSGQALLSGGDSQFVARALTAGCRLFYAPQMAARHWVAPHRISPDYLCALAGGRGHTKVAVDRSLGCHRPLRALRRGLGQALIGALREGKARLAGDDGAALAARLLRHRGQGTLLATLSKHGGAPLAARPRQAKE